MSKWKISTYYSICLFYLILPFIFSSIYFLKPPFEREVRVHMVRIFFQTREKQGSILFSHWFLGSRNYILLSHAVCKQFTSKYLINNLLCFCHCECIELLFWQDLTKVLVLPIFVYLKYLAYVSLISREFRTLPRLPIDAEIKFLFSLPFKCIHENKSVHHPNTLTVWLGPFLLCVHHWAKSQLNWTLRSICSFLFQTFSHPLFKAKWTWNLFLFFMASFHYIKVYLIFMLNQFFFSFITHTWSTNYISLHKGPFCIFSKAKASFCLIAFVISLLSITIFCAFFTPVYILSNLAIRISLYVLF